MKKEKKKETDFLIDLLDNSGWVVLILTIVVLVYFFNFLWKAIT